MSNQEFPVPLSDPLASSDAQWLAGRTAAVAGGGLSGPLGNVGFALAWLYHRAGAKVAVLDRDLVAAERTVAAIEDDGGTAKAFETDVLSQASTSAAVAAAAEEFGSLDVVATSIGGGGATSVFGLSEEDWDRAFDLNLKSAWRLMVASEPHMTAGGSIVTVSSGAAEGRGPAMPYSVAKAGVEKLTTGAAATLAPRGIRVNCIRVGMIWGAFAARGMDEELREVRRKNVALQTEGNPWDIASAALFLSTDQARWISGQVLSVDGGGFAMRSTGAAGADTVKKQ
ncbi:SDR family NAD(P)-dependent oxidoreductase [Nesterenkonia sp. NBAIMH1]|uniref:SDR family NAD(P)-dependent oxidoreductase n=1 Tax=Nesterenkonia sp. NBAIMH1 TaxID=2600320 RepID=UPI001AEF8AC4|nr:SDR family oxidoreductase [Nesterenkonia sp. NBAIMH1]